MKRKKKKAVKFFFSFFFYSRIVLGEISKVKPNGSGRDKTDTDSFFHLNHLGRRCVAVLLRSLILDYLCQTPYGVCTSACLSFLVFFLEIVPC